MTIKMESGRFHRRNLLVKGEGTLLGRNTSLCQDTKDPGVFKYCVQGCQGRCRVKSKGKESAQKMEGCLGDSREGGSSGETQSGLDARFVTLSLSISMKRKAIACSGSCEALVDTGSSLILGPRRLVNNIQRLISATPRGSKVKGHAPGSLLVSIHEKDL